MSDVDDYLAARGITPELAAAAGLFPEPDASLVYPDFRRAAALVLPYFDAHGEPVGFDRDGESRPFCRVRYMGDLPPQRGRKKPMRYTQPADSGSRAYLPTVTDRPWHELLADASEPLIITEGEIKSLAVSAYVAPCIGLGGVNSTVRDGQFLPELAEAAWQDRVVYVCFDSDAAENPKVTCAEARLVQELQTKRGARCRLVRIPAGENGAKMGIDDFLVAYGTDGVLGLIEDASDLFALDAKVISLNASCAWIEQEGLIYDLEARDWIRKDNFTNGSRFASLKHYVPGKKGGDAKEVQVAKTWLTHAHAQRFARVIFKPGEGDVVADSNGNSCMNLWTGWDERPGDVTLWLELSYFLFQNMEPGDRDFLIKLHAYKFQHPEEKIPLATVLIGQQGCGKSLWAQCIREACGQHGYPMASSELVSDFSGWQENTLIVTIDEAKEDDMLRGKDVLKSMISEKHRSMNAKYRAARPIETFYQMIITSNNRGAGAFSGDDRRMIVVDCPPKREEAWYTRIGDWRRAGGPRALAHYLLNYDLAGWKPPSQAPMTAEKHMAYVEALTAVQQFADECATATENSIKMRLDGAVAWSEVNVTSANPAAAAQARLTLDSVGLWQVRPFYTPDELATILPMFIDSGRIGKKTTAGEISRQLRDAGIHYLQCSDDPRGFMWRGKRCQFLVIAEPAEWARPLSQAEFERCMASFPRYSQIRARRAG